MTHLKVPVTRITGGTVFEKGENRPVIVTLSPPNILSFRVKGLRGRYTLTVEGCYMMAVKSTMARKG